MSSSTLKACRCRRRPQRRARVREPKQSGGSMSAEVAELVVGSDSLIGGALVRSLRAGGRRVFSTTRRPFGVGTDTLHLDLANVPTKWNGPPVAVAYLTAGITRLEA